MTTNYQKKYEYDFYLKKVNEMKEKFEDVTTKTAFQSLKRSQEKWLVNFEKDKEKIYPTDVPYFPEIESIMANERVVQPTVQLIKNRLFYFLSNIIF